MWRLRIELGQRVRNYYSYKLHLLHKLRDVNLSYLSKDKNGTKKFNIAVWVKVCNKYIFFDEETRGVCIPFRGNPF